MPQCSRRGDGEMVKPALDLTRVVADGERGKRRPQSGRGWLAVKACCAPGSAWTENPPPLGQEPSRPEKLPLEREALRGRSACFVTGRYGFWTRLALTRNQAPFGEIAWKLAGLRGLRAFVRGVTCHLATLDALVFLHFRQGSELRKNADEDHEAPARWTPNWVGLVANFFRT